MAPPKNPSTGDFAGEFTGAAESDAADGLAGEAFDPLVGSVGAVA